MSDAINPLTHELLDIEVSCRHLLDISPDAVLIYHHQRVVHVNAECVRLFGATSHEQLFGLSPLDLVSTDRHAAMAERIERVITKRQQAPIVKTQIRRLDGSLIKVECLAVPVPQRDGSTAALLIFRDLTLREQAFGERQRSETQVRTILETAMDGIISMNERQEIILFNTAAEAIFGVQADQVLGTSIDLLIPNRFRGQHRNDVEGFGQGEIQQRRMGMQRTVLAQRASGEEFPIEASISQTNLNGEKIYTVILRDVTEAVRHRQQIEQQSQMLDQVSDSVSVVDLDSRITYWNHAAAQLFGWSADEALGRNDQELLYRGDPSVLLTMQQETKKNGSWVGELTKVTRSGKPVIVENRRTVLRNASGEVKGYLSFDIDITDRKKRELAARRSQRLESIGTLAGGIAHDLNNVLTPILMGARLLATGRAKGESQKLLDTMVTSAQRGADLVKQVLAFAGGIRGERSPIVMAKVMAETRGLMEHTLPKSIQVDFQVDSDCPQVLGDATELLQVLMNLCINARDAMPEGGILTVSAKPILLNGNCHQLNPDAQPGLCLLLEVTDTGSGMTPEVLERIFDPFFTTKDIGKGTGLGLATVQGIIKNHGGFINVYSELKHGTKFSVYLPAIASAETINKGPANPSHESGNGQTVLLVDDEAFILQMTTAALQGAEYKVLTAQDGSAAIEIFSRHHGEISAVLLDMMMPGLDGLQTLLQLQRIDPQVVVIASSGLRTAQREAEVLERGAKAFLPKPYSEAQLFQTLAKVLKTRS